VNRLIAFGSMPWNQQLALVLIFVLLVALFWPAIVSLVRREKKIPHHIVSRLNTLQAQATEIGERVDGNNRSIVALHHKMVIDRAKQNMRDNAQTIRDLPRNGARERAKDAWPKWRVAHSDWQTNLQHWMVYSQDYLNADLLGEIHKTPPGWFDRNWQLDDVDFPSPQEKRDYQEWVAMNDAWEKLRPIAERRISFVCAMGRLPQGSELPPV